MTLKQLIKNIRFLWNCDLKEWFSGLIKSDFELQEAVEDELSLIHYPNEVKIYTKK